MFRRHPSRPLSGALYLCQTQASVPAGQAQVQDLAQAQAQNLVQMRMRTQLQNLVMVQAQALVSV